MASAGLGLRLHDTLYGSDLHHVFHTWWEYAKQHYLPIKDGEIVASMTSYYDPILGVHMPAEVEPVLSLMLAQWLLPTKPDEARVLVDWAIDKIGWRSSEAVEDQGGKQLAQRELISGMMFAREFGDSALSAKLSAYAEANYEPTWDQATGEFTWGFGLNEPYPRGQLNAFAALVEALSEGAWQKLYAEPNLRKFVEPSVTGVDFPNFCLSQAVYDVDRRSLMIASDQGVPAAAGQPTKFRVTNVDPEYCTVVADGEVSDDWRAVDGDIEVSTTVGVHTFVVRMN